MQNKKLRGKPQPEIDDVVFDSVENDYYVIDWITHTPQGIMYGLKDDRSNAISIPASYFVPYSKIAGVKWKITESQQNAIKQHEKSNNKVILQHDDSTTAAQKQQQQYNKKHSFLRQTANLHPREVESYSETLEKNNNVVELLYDKSILELANISFIELLEYNEPPRIIQYEINRLLNENYSNTKFRKILSAIKELENHKPALPILVFNSIIHFMYSLIGSILHVLFFEKVKQ